MARLFVGVWLSAALREEVTGFMEVAERSSRGFKWSRPEQLHFTLKFLGEVPAVRVPPLVRELKKEVAAVASFSLNLGLPGCFPNTHNPKVVWLGLAQGEPELHKLAVAVENATIRAGLAASDRPFVPHLTLARSRSAPLQLMLPGGVKFENPASIRSFCLVESQLTPAGSKYRTLMEFPLKNP